MTDDPGDIEVEKNEAKKLLQRANQLNDLGAIELYDKALATDSSLAETVWFSKGVLYYEKRAYLWALLCFENVVKINPKSASAWNEMGKTYHWLGQYENEYDCFAKTVELKPNEGVGWNNLGNALVNLGMLDEAEISYKKALTCYHPFGFAEVGLSKIAVPSTSVFGRIKQWLFPVKK